MRVLLTSTPGKGSLEPLLPLASAMAADGNRIAVASSATLSADVDRLGYEFLAAGIDWHTSDERSLDVLRAAGNVRKSPRLSGRERSEWVVTALFINVAARRMLLDLVDIVAAWCPDIVIRESLEFSGCVAAEFAGIPHASVVADAECALDLRSRLSEPLAGLRALVGLPPDRGCEMPYRYLHVCSMPAEFYGPDAVFAPNTHFCKVTPPDHQETGLPKWGDGDSSVPRILVSFGTVFHRTAGVYTAVIDALATEKVQVQVASGYDSEPERLAATVPAPEHISVARWLPLRRMLSGTDVYVTHGGFNSVREAVAAGVPLVVIPLGAGQYYAAERLAALGVGIVVPPGDRTPERIRDAVTAVLSDDSYRRRARWLKERMEALLETSPVRMIERLVVKPAARRRVS